MSELSCSSNKSTIKWKTRTKRKYNWYVLIVMKDFYHTSINCGYYDSWGWTQEEKLANTGIYVNRATSKENAQRKYICDHKYYCFGLVHEEYRVMFIKEFDTREDADIFVAQIPQSFITQQLFNSTSS